ncbi:hypothetical protein SLEP1_g44423 [Rubroshorea leprosula]|uniref:Uncharacterized protein n=1 Tax=Rubroshorea leprosula TaxID=152421 RepID=A0AAV5LG50_9ROSI|nr:hypothetical protein SLEP1_g44423 [Rubroshorea leprosula]
MILLHHLIFSGETDIVQLQPFQEIARKLKACDSELTGSTLERTVRAFGGGSRLLGERRSAACCCCWRHDERQSAAPLYCLVLWFLLRSAAPICCLSCVALRASMRPAWRNSPGGFAGSAGLDGLNGFPGFGRANRPNGPGGQPSPFHAPGAGRTGRTGRSGPGFKTLTQTTSNVAALVCNLQASG